jgi:DsbC/DsbD-like thiol-disulfide interchange protein
MRFYIFFSVCFFLILSGFNPVNAATSPWQDIGGGKARLVAMMQPGSNKINAAIEFRLEKGWKTYWREPGSSGIPPQFDFSRSKHFIPGETLFPAPQRLEAGGVEFAGYKDIVSFVINGQATVNPPGNGVIRLNMLAGVCEEICIPATAEFEFAFSALMLSDAETQKVLARAGERIPQKPTDNFKIVESRLADGGKLIIETLVPNDAAAATLFVEGPSDMYLPLPEPIGQAGGKAMFEVDIGELADEDKLFSSKFRYTLVTGDKSIEQWLQLKK